MSRRHDEGRDALVSELGIHRGKDDRDVRMGAVGDEQLVPVEDVGIPITGRRGSDRRWIATRLRFCQGETPQLRSTGERPEELPASALRVPNFNSGSQTRELFTDKITPLLPQMRLISSITRV